MLQDCLIFVLSHREKQSVYHIGRTTRKSAEREKRRSRKRLLRKQQPSKKSGAPIVLNENSIALGEHNRLYLEGWWCPYGRFGRAAQHETHFSLSVPSLFCEREFTWLGFQVQYHVFRSFNTSILVHSVRPVSRDMVSLPLSLPSAPSPRPLLLTLSTVLPWQMI